MDKKHVCIISDFDFRVSGYFNIAVATGRGLAELGYEVKAVGLGYKGEEHDFPMSIIPCKNFTESLAMTQNLANMWGIDILLAIMDLPVHERYLSSISDRGDTKYVGIAPIEGDPLCMSDALTLSQMDKAFIISKFGTQEARRANVDAIYFPVAINSDAWKIPTEEERNSMRAALGFEDDEFVFLVVAYNQERKLLSRAVEMFADFVYEQDDIEELLSIDRDLKPVNNAKLVLVTVEHSQIGWKLRDLAQEFGISDRLIIYERGMSHSRLWGIYAASDAFLLTSKAEGLGMILLESMAVGLPTVGTNCTGIKELLADGRGLLIPVAYNIRDPFGNQRRYFADRAAGTELLKKVYNNEGDFVKEMTAKARKFVEDRTWEAAISILNEHLVELLEESDGEEATQQEDEFFG